MPALVSAPAKKSFSNASCPIFACNSFKSIAGADTDSAPNTLAARSSNWFFQSTIWLGCTSCNLASSARVFSPLMASTATLALKSGEWFRRGLLLMVITAFSGSQPGSMSQSVHLSSCSDFRRHLCVERLIHDAIGNVHHGLKHLPPLMRHRDGRAH